MKRNNKKKLFLMLAAATVGILGACGLQADEKMERPETAAVNTSDTSPAVVNEEGLSIVCTSFPQYDFVSQIIGDNPAGIEVTYLLGSGADMHNYQPSAEDMIKIHTSDLFLYIGGESDQWVGDVVAQEKSDTFHAMALLDVVEAKREELVEGMQQEQEHDEHGEEEEEYDEHVWLSLKNAITITDVICDEISVLNPEYADEYKANATAYKEQLAQLDGQYEQIVADAVRKEIMVADRFPFRYLADDYGLTYYAAFPGCSAETEASFETIIYLSETLNERKLSVVFTIDGSDGSIAKTVIGNSKDKTAEIKMLNSIQSVSRDEIAAGVTYLGIMEENLNQLKEALN